MRTLAAVALAAAVGTTVSAHRRDEYLQAARIAIEPDQVAIELDLTPGAAIAEPLLAVIDTDRDGSLSIAEQDAYARRVLGEVSVVLDGRPLPLRLSGAAFPDPGAARRGEAAVRLRIHAGVAVLRAGSHQLAFTNAHLPKQSVYLANALVSESARVSVTAQHRTVDQRALTIDFAVAAPPVAATAGAPLIVAFAFGAASIVPLARRRRQ